MLSDGPNTELWARRTGDHLDKVGDVGLIRHTVAVEVGAKVPGLSAARDEQNEQREIALVGDAVLVEVGLAADLGFVAAEVAKGADNPRSSHEVHTLSFFTPCVARSIHTRRPREQTVVIVDPI